MMITITTTGSINWSKRVFGFGLKNGDDQNQNIIYCSGVHILQTSPPFSRWPTSSSPTLRSPMSSSDSLRFHFRFNFIILMFFVSFYFWIIQTSISLSAVIVVMITVLMVVMMILTLHCTWLPLCSSSKPRCFRDGTFPPSSAHSALSFRSL